LQNKRKIKIQLMSALFWGVALIVVVGVSGAIIAGCNTQGCTDNRSALPLMGFYSNQTEEGMALDSLDMGGVGAPHDSLLISSGQRVKSLYLPFRYDCAETSFRFHYDYKLQGLDDPAIDDIVTFRYTTEPYFASEECGAYYIYTIRSVEYTRHLIDSVAIVDSVITNVDMERIKVFFRVADIVPPEEPENPDAPDNPDTPDEPDNPGDDAGVDAGGETETGAKGAPATLKIGRMQL